MSIAMQRTVFDAKGLYPNVDFFPASVYRALGIPTDLFTPVFAVSRMAGWTAHIMEQHADNRLIRPDSEYLGERDLTWQPLSERGQTQVPAGRPGPGWPGPGPGWPGPGRAGRGR